MIGFGLDDEQALQHKARDFAHREIAPTTQLRLRFETDDNDNSAADYVSFFTGNTPMVTDRPELIVTYYTP